MIIKVFDSDLVIDSDLVEEAEEEIKRQVEEFLNGDRRSFDLDFSFPGGATGHILKEMNNIPYGETRTYGKLAEKLGSSAIAVGQVCARNPLPLFIACHRVVGKDSIGGYQAGERAKRKLLEFEKGQVTT